MKKHELYEEEAALVAKLTKEFKKVLRAHPRQAKRIGCMCSYSVPTIYTSLKMSTGMPSLNATIAILNAFGCELRIVQVRPIRNWREDPRAIEKLKIDINADRRKRREGRKPKRFRIKKKPKLQPRQPKQLPLEDDFLRVTPSGDQGPG